MRADQTPSTSRAFFSGVAPLGPIALILIATIALTALARPLTAGSGFPTQQTVSLALVAVGILALAIALIIGGVRALRQVKQWQQAGQSAQASAALWGLAVVALVLLLPLLLAILIPQHPAPNLAP